MKLNEIQDLIKFVAKSGVCEVELETKEVKIIIKTAAAKKGGRQENESPFMVQATTPFVAPVQQMQQAAPVADQKSADAKKTAEDNSKLLTIKSPMIGTFYRSPSPDKPVFVNVGDEIQPGKPICIIEAMKLFNEIESDIKGKIVKVLVDDSTPVEYDQPLFLVEPN
ncbi:MAG TPA: acetyl-CoA carboxylase biotin carboxyl carrier protein [Bacteroidia bacterium]|nr:acetyl-CoA carboxylase biotin carboxyl carrier protein [Bacteroidia bacterium]